MTFERGNTGYFLAFIIIGGILGSALGTLAVRLLPSMSVLTQNLTSAIGFNIEILSISLRVNIAAIVGMGIGFFLFKKA